ncbi:protein UL34 [Saimiriine betaherpesvirus 4]|uniref:Protein UL34 n=1 Tax=Saimiriine betaherpesvirus 4 TaxID=1535247 RepID=G8XSU8_9BETA|nr:protein UL34 [Saimiriine betaherpesvirus 4]AEV80895.1 protein UL34 [Saimiriine betaherpesvirus 4]
MNITITTRDFSNTEEDSQSSFSEDFNLTTSVSRTYRSILRAEGKKKYLLEQLPPQPGGLRRNSNLFLYCTDKDHRRLTHAISQLKYPELITEAAEIHTIVNNVRCRLRRINADEANHLQNLIYGVCTFFNQLVFVAQVRHYCDKNERALWFSREELSKRCGEKSVLGSYIQRLVNVIDNAQHRELCCVLIGLLYQTPHMWARSIRLLAKIKAYLERCFLTLLLDSGISIDTAFESAYHNDAYKTLFYMDKTDPCKQVTTENLQTSIELDPSVITT